MANNLSQIQKAAVEYINGTSMILAGAGSGKTRVLTFKIAHLIDSGISPNRIMALTFTNKAAKEMKDRVAQIIGKENANLIKMGTFHSIFSQILRYEARAIGKDSSFSIYDDNDSKKVIKDILDEMNFDTEVYKPGNILNRIGMAKNCMITSEEYCNNPHIFEDDLKNKLQYMGAIYKRYEEKLAISNALDFDDLLLKMFTLLQQNAAIREHYEYEFDAILVDEFQDTNTVQLQILLQLCQNRQNLTVVGDDAQSIYSFRGANINNILTFQQFFPNAKIFKLGQNYRSTRTIVAAANSLIHQNKAQIEKKVFSEGQIGDKIHELQFYNDRSEGQYIALSIREIQRYEKCSLSDIAILFRNNALSRSVEEALLKMRIPYQLHNSVSFFDRKDIKNILSVFKFICNLNDDIAFEKSLIFPPKGIGAKTIESLKLEAEKRNTCMFIIASDLEKYDVQITKKAQKAIKEYIHLVEELIVSVADKRADDAADEILRRLKIDEYIHQGTEDDKNKMITFNELFSSIESFVEDRIEEKRMNEIFLSSYLNDIAIDSRDEDKKEDAVQLMTIHAAKGLEFNTVYVIGMEDNIFPSLKSSSNPMQLEEERRLAYVAITRAMKHCYLTSCKRRWLYGEEAQHPKSRFITEIGEQFIEHIDPYQTEEPDKDDEQGFFD